MFAFLSPLCWPLVFFALAQRMRAHLLLSVSCSNVNDERNDSFLSFNLKASSQLAATTGCDYRRENIKCNSRACAWVGSYLLTVHQLTCPLTHLLYYFVSSSKQTNKQSWSSSRKIANCVVFVVYNFFTHFDVNF